MKPGPETDALYRHIVEDTDEGIWMIDAAATTTYVNPKMAWMLGYSSDEMTGRALLDFMDDAGRAIATRNLARRRSGIAEPHEFVFRRKDGSELHASLMTNPILENGVYAGALAMVRDVADRKHVEATLRAAEERFRSLFEHSPIVLWEEDGSVLKAHLDDLRADGVTDFRAYFTAHPAEVMRCIGMVKVLDVNQASVTQYEARDKAELIAGLHRVLTPESHGVLADEIIALAEGHTVFEAETTDQTFTGRLNHILLKTLVAPGCEHTFARVYVSIVDITARKQAEERVRKLASFPELNPNAVLQLASDGTIGYANPAFEGMARRFGSAPAQLLPAQTAALVRTSLALDEAQVLETRHGKRTIAWSFHPVTAQQTVHCYAADITDRLALEEQLRQSQKMDAIGHLAGGIAHDFNNLLTVIHGNTTLLQRGKASPGFRAEALEHIAKATDRAAALVRQLLTFSRQQVLQPRELDLNDVVVNLVKMLERVVREDVHVKLDLPGRPLHTHADAGMLDQVLMNLVVNARDAMPDGGTLLLATSAVVIGHDDLHAFPDLRPGRYACLRVTDTGTGIPPELLARIFEPFFTTKDPGKGTGLGLATVFGIVKQHSGTVSVASVVGQGTTFTVFLPATGEVATESPAATEELEAAGGSEAILVVEDEEAVRRLVQQVLEMHGYRVSVVSTGAAALELPRDAKFDLVLTDVIMPGGVSGRDLAERLRTTAPGLKVIYMSGYTGELAGRGLELREGVNFLQKPFGPAPLLRCVRGCLDGSAG